MKKNKYLLIILIIGSIFIANFVVAQINPEGGPFQAILDAIVSLSRRIEGNEATIAILDERVSKLENDCISSYTDNENETITDNCTDLVWQKEPGDNRIWSEANTYCDNLTLASQSDWRLPNINELNSIIDYEKNPAIDPSFISRVHESIPDRSFNWSSTTYLQSDSRAWVVEFFTGDTGTLFKGEFVVFPRCVKN